MSFKEDGSFSSHAVIPSSPARAAIRECPSLGRQRAQSRARRAAACCSAQTGGGAGKGVRLVEKEQVFLASLPTAFSLFSSAF